MSELTLPRRLGRFLIAGIICSFAAWGTRFLPPTYQPSRPLYALAWLGLSGAAFLVVRNKNFFLGSVAGILFIIFGGVFLISLLIEN